MEPTTKSPTELGLTPLAELAQQPLFVGKPAVYLYTAAGTRVDRELVALSMQLRLAEALEGTTGTSRLARLTVPNSQKGQFCQFVAAKASEWGTSSPFVEGVEDQVGIGAVVTVQYSRAEELFYLGTSWQQKLAARHQEGGQNG